MKSYYPWNHQSLHILRRTVKIWQNLLILLRSVKKVWTFRHILWPSQNMWTLSTTIKIPFFGPDFISQKYVSLNVNLVHQDIKINFTKNSFEKSLQGDFNVYWMIIKGYQLSYCGSFALGFSVLLRLPTRISLANCLSLSIQKNHLLKINNP